jgi:hypothetical protein
LSTQLPQSGYTLVSGNGSDDIHCATLLVRDGKIRLGEASIGAANAKASRVGRALNSEP